MSESPIPLELEHGGVAYIVAHTGDAVTLATPVAAPPGATVLARFGDIQVRIKVRGCRQQPQPDGSPGFRLEGRFVSLTRSEREALLASRIGTKS